MTNKKKVDGSRNLALAEAVRQACIEAAREGFRDASISGLCSEGAMEAAISAMQRLDLGNLTEDEYYMDGKTGSKL